MFLFFSILTDQTVRRFGDNLSVLQSVLRRAPDYETDNEMSFVDSFSSSDQV